MHILLDKYCFNNNGDTIDLTNGGINIFFYSFVDFLFKMKLKSNII